MRENAWYMENSEGGFHPVASLGENAFGIYDMFGNVSELVFDCYHRGYENAPADGSSWGWFRDGNCAGTVERGGAWNDHLPFLRSSARVGSAGDYTGFRCVKDIVGDSR